MPASVDAANASTVPVEVAYTTGNDRATAVIEVPLPAADDAVGRPLGAFGSFGGLWGVLLAIGLAIPAAIGLLARRYG